VVANISTSRNPRGSTASRAASSFAIADAAYPEASANGEAWRMRWLEQRLVQSGTCPNGYTITARNPVLLSTGALGSIYDVYYEGRCK
jgi:hypothetical protein